MRRFGKILGRVLLVFLITLGALLFFAPSEEVKTRITFAETLSAATLDSYFTKSEAAYTDITPGTEKRVIWAGQTGTKTPVSVVYLHGFSATSEETRPVPDLVAKALGANLIYTRLTGHGRGGDAMAKATAGNWINDMAEALAAARATGDRVLIIGTSTGGTLAALAALDPALSQDIEGIVFISPNFGIANAAARILTWPGARWWVPLFAGQTRSFTPMNTRQEKFWTTSYPTVAALPVAALVQHTVAKDFAAATLPALFLFSDSDSVVKASATRDIAKRWGGPVTLAPQDLPPGNDPYHHVIAGDILSPDMTEPVADQIINWAKSLN